MKVGFMVMIQKQSKNHHDGRANNHQEQKRSGRSTVQQRACSLFFFDVKGTVHCESIPPNTMVNSDFNVRFWDSGEKICDEKDQNFGASQLAPSSRQRTPHTSLKTIEFVTNNNMIIVPHPPYSPDFAPWFRLVSWIENETEGTTFWNSVWHPQGIASGTRQH
jgi:hypothetical protein